MTFEPLAERLRPKSLDDYIGQKHLVGEGRILRRMIESGSISSFILHTFGGKCRSQGSARRAQSLRV